MSPEGGSEESINQDPKHISEVLQELVYDHLEPGVPIEPTPNRFVADEHVQQLREKKLADADIDLPVGKTSAYEMGVQNEVLSEVERQRQEQLYRLRKQK